VPHAVLLRHLARLVDKDEEREAIVFYVAADDGRLLRDDGDDRKASARVFRRPFCQFTEPAATVRSPRAAVKGEEYRPAREVRRERPSIAAIRWQREIRRLRAHGQRFRSIAHLSIDVGPSFSLGIDRPS
jgi:hypothetical protein